MQDFHWHRCPKGEALIEKVLGDAIALNPVLKKFSIDLLAHTSSRLFDWVDHVVVGPEYEKELLDAGYELLRSLSDVRVFHHPGAQLPLVVLKDRNGILGGVAISVDSLEDFFLARGENAAIEGSYLGKFRRALVSKEGGVSFWAVERREKDRIEPELLSDSEVAKRLKVKGLWALRDRRQDDEFAAFAEAIRLAQAMVEEVGEALAASFMLETERSYWQRRNRAGQVQKNRQDFLGLGWANHDHHTFRSSRRHFKELVRLFEVLGFRSRERFYAGEEAGWGAQVMEHPHIRLVLFLDVDLDPHELQVDFAHEKLPLRDKLGTIGLWCELHGDSILQAGMHHLEAQFMFEELKESLHASGIQMMDPFSNFPYLKQAFTKGEMWPVDPKRLDRLAKSGLITEAQKEQFLQKGAVGSHMENLQRREGYKGFNQKNVSNIIKRTDPRALS